MVKITKQQAQLGIPNRVPGQYIVRITKRGPVVQKWPRKRGHSRTPAEFYQQTEFGMAASEVAFKDGHQIEQAIHHANGVNNVWRDFLTGAPYGTIVEFWFEDGTQWQSYRTVTVNAQLILDQVTDTVGAMLWRSDVGWIEVSPGSNGYFLMISNGVPTFVPIAPPAGAPQLPGGFGFMRLDAGTITLFNNVSGTVVPIQAGTVINALNVYATAAAASSVLAPVVYKRTANNAASLVAYGAQVTGVVNGVNRRPFSPPVVIADSEMYFIGMHISGAGYSQANSNSAVTSWVSNQSFPPPASLSGLAQAFNNNVPHPWID